MTPTRRRAIPAAGSFALTTAIALGASGWGVGLLGGASGATQSIAVSNLSISAQSSGGGAGPLSPGATGDVVIRITNPNAAPVTVTGMDLPASTAFAAGFADSGLTAAQPGCSAATSQVAWSDAAPSGPSTHVLGTPLVVGASATLTVTLTGAAVMGTSAPAACEGTFFGMPALEAVTATTGGGIPTPSPATDAWTG